MEPIKFNPVAFGIETFLGSSLGYGVALASGINPLVGCAITGTFFGSFHLLQIKEFKALEKGVFSLEKDNADQAIKTIRTIKAIAAVLISSLGGYLLGQAIGAPLTFSACLLFHVNVAFVMTLLVTPFVASYLAIKGLKALAEKVYDFALGE